MINGNNKTFNTFDECINTLFEEEGISNYAEGKAKSCAYFFEGKLSFLSLWDSEDEGIKYATPSEMKEIAKEQFEKYGEVAFEALSASRGCDGLVVKIKTV